METGDLIYLIIVAVFMLFSYISDSKKKKKTKARQKSTPPSVPATHTQPKRRSFFDDLEATVSRQKDKIELKLPKKDKRSLYTQDKSRTIFQSSMDLVTDFNKESSLSQALQEHDINSYAEHIESMSFDYDPVDLPDEMTDDAVQNKQHPIVKQLKGANRLNELAKGVIYSEILNRKY